MSREHKDAVAVECALWPKDVDPWDPDSAKLPDPPNERCLIYLHNGKLILACEDPAYSGGFSDEAVMQLLRMCATAISADSNERLFEFGTDQSILSVRDNGSVGVALSDDRYSGQLSSADAFKLALAVLRSKT
jgi:hypothetical protein